MAAKVFALIVFVSDGFLEIRQVERATAPAARVFAITSQLPLELQMVFCYRLVDSAKEGIPGKDSEIAFQALAKLV